MPKGLPRGWKAFKTRVPAKWVFAGEHAVLRGKMAIALPSWDYFMELTFEPGVLHPGAHFQINPPQALKEVVLLLDLAKPVLEKLLTTCFYKNQKTLNPEQLAFFKPAYMPAGLLQLKSSIPMGAGMGSSAALCVALARWLLSEFELPLAQTAFLAVELEHFFHVRSSGMDVAVIATEKPIQFYIGGPARALPLLALPTVSFHDTGLRAKTKDCVAQVNAFYKGLVAYRADYWDEEMGAAAETGLAALLAYSEAFFKSPCSSSFKSQVKTQTLGDLVSALKRAQACFRAWGLVPTQAMELEESLLAQGALAVKMIGAGGGGFLLALWDEDSAAGGDRKRIVS